MFKPLLILGHNNWETRAIANAAKNDGWNTLFSPTPEHNGEIRLYGSVEWTDTVAKYLGLKLFDCPLDFLPNMMTKGLTKRSILLTKGSAFNKPQAYRDSVNALFIKPARNKTFEARVYKPHEYIEAEDDENILVSEPVEFKLEIRTFWLNGEMVTDSPYMKNMKPIEILDPTDSYWKKADLSWDDFFSYLRFINSIKPHLKEFPSIVVDLGLLKESSEWCIIEANNPHSSGIYDCNPYKVWQCLKA